MFLVSTFFRQKIARLPHVVPHRSHPQVRHASTETPIKLRSRRESRSKLRLPARFQFYWKQELAALNKALKLPEGKGVGIMDIDVRNQVYQRWLQLSPEEQIAVTEAQRQERRTFVNKCYADARREDIAVLDHIAKGMAGYLDQLQGVKNLSLDEFRNQSWLRQDHRDMFSQHSWVLRGLDLKDDVQSFISTRLAVATAHRRERMVYFNFDANVTGKYGVIIENWPPVPFGSPDRLNKFVDITGLYLMWKSGATRFRRLSAQEKKEWDKTREKLYEERKRLGLVPDPSKPKVSLGKRPAHGLLIDTKTIGTIDQIAAFMDFVLVPKSMPTRPKIITQENVEPQTPPPNP